MIMLSHSIMDFSITKIFKLKSDFSTSVYNGDLMERSGSEQILPKSY